jgi:hypothetical protein
MPGEAPITSPFGLGAVDVALIALTIWLDRRFGVFPGKNPEDATLPFAPLYRSRLNLVELGASMLGSRPKRRSGMGPGQASRPHR